ncbi:MAG TPA: S-methyl-5-thioribose-1-phosphate isomerase, partial [Candidatus Obscuribacterales bacterium]
MARQANAASLQLSMGAMPIKVQDKKILLLDQRLLPEKTEYFDATSLDDMCFAIKDMVVRGAPSIGAAAAVSMAAEAVRSAKVMTTKDEFLKQLREAKARLDSTRPTAVNLKWATEKMLQRAVELTSSHQPHLEIKEIGESMFAYALALIDEHLQRNKTLSDLGADLVQQNANILTHCNAGSLAVCGWGSALGVIRSAHLRGLSPRVFVDETRPRNQGSKLTVWELMQDGIPSTLICDSMAGQLMSKKEIDL